jgi:hypothetical protein
MKFNWALAALRRKFSSIHRCVLGVASVSGEQETTSLTHVNKYVAPERQSEVTGPPCHTTDLSVWHLHERPDVAELNVAKLADLALQLEACMC